MTDSPQPANPPSFWTFWIPRLVFAIVAPVLLLLLVEGALRAFNFGYSTNLMEPCSIHGRASSCYNLFFAAPFFPPGMIKTPQFFSISQVKPPHTYRILVLGESAAMGDPDPAYGFSRYLEVMLRQRVPRTNFDVVNTGMVAINSHVSRIMARELARYQPDLYLVYAGSNEVVGPYGPGTLLNASSLSLPVIRASILARSSRIGQLLTDSGKPRGEWRGMEMFLDKQVRADSPRMQPAYRNFESNLRDIAVIAQDAHANVLLITVASNLRDSAPFSSLHREGLSPDAQSSFSALLQKGDALEKAGQFSDALSLYSQAAQIDDQFAELHFHIALCNWALGDFAGAKKHYILARDLDTLRFRADSRINEIIRSVGASSGSHVHLLDAESLFSAESHNGVIGAELLYDHVHLTPLGSYTLARAAFDQIVPLLPADVRGSARPADAPSELDCERLLALTGHDRARVASEMFDRLQRPPFTQQSNHLEQMQSLIFRASGVTESPQDTLTQYQWAISQNPNDLTLHYKFGFFLFNFDRNAAAQELVRARPNDEFPVYLPDGTRVL
jgi:tetratricopeptide (TPR) repeat protein